MSKLSKLKLLLDNDRSTKGMNLKQHAKFIGLRYPTYYNYLQEAYEPNRDNYKILSKYFKLDVERYVNNDNITHQSPSPCTSHPVCQELCAICEGLSDYWKHELLEYAQFIHLRHLKKPLPAYRQAIQIPRDQITELCRHGTQRSRTKTTAHR